ncbi:MAG: hypothetical protein AAGD86_07770 [Pseudomonadota bacterium]
MPHSTLAPAALLAAATLCAALLLPLPAPPTLALPATVALAALVLLPALPTLAAPWKTALVTALGWSAGAGLCAALALVGRAPAATLSGAALAVTLIVVAGAGLWHLLDRRAARPARWRFATVLLLTGTAPLWAAPAASLNDGIATLVACASPLSLLGVLVDYDYLRSGFFYQHSALGALSYRYPSAGAFVGLYATLAVALWALGRLVTTPTEKR